MKFYLCVIISFLICLLSKLSEAQTCSKSSFKEVDVVVAKLMTFGNSGRKFPESLKDVPKYCEDSKSMITTVEKLNKKCNKGLIKQVLSIIMYSAKRSFQQICRTKSTPKRLSELVSSAKCLNKGHNEIQKCYDTAIDNFLGIKQIDDKLKLPMACCAYHRKNTCMTEISEKIDVCTEKHVDIAISFIESISGTALNLVCREYSENSDKCDKFRNIKINKTSSKLRTKSFFLPLIEVFESFKEI